MTMFFRKQYYNELGKYRSYVFIALLCFILFAYGSIVLLTSHTKRPWCDETWLASPAYNLIQHGHMGTSFLEPVPYWKDIDRYTYWEPPLHFLVQALWYQVFGFSLFSLRALSLFWGTFAIAAWYSIIRALSGSRWAAILAVMLIAFDFFLIYSAADGRMDMMTVALHVTGLAAYLKLRKSYLNWAILISHCFVVASGLTHPNGIMALANLVCLMLFFDYRRLRWQHLLVAIIPYGVGGVGYSWYIIQNLPAFLEQFGNNFLQGSNISLWDGIRNEIVQRYGYAAGFAPGTPAIGKFKIIIFLGYAVGFLGILFIGFQRQHRDYRILWIITLVNIVIMTTLISNKHAYYFVYITPFYAALLSLFVHWCWHRWTSRRLLLSMMVWGLLLVHFTGSMHRIIQNTYGVSYLPVVNVLRTQIALKEDEKAPVLMGTSDVTFQLGFDFPIIDDMFLGYYTGKKADLIVMDDWCYQSFHKQLAIVKPEISRYTKDLLNQYEVIYENAAYQVYRRK